MYVIYAPGAWCDDAVPAMETNAWEIEQGIQSGGCVEVVEQFFDIERSSRRGRGTQHRFDLATLDAVSFLKGEAKYRWEWNVETLDEAFDSEDRAWRRKCAHAAKVLMDRCETVLNEHK